MKYSMTPTLLHTHRDAACARDRQLPRCGGCNRILKFRWHGGLCASCAIGHSMPGARNDR
jgi:hypothetical protein